MRMGTVRRLGWSALGGMLMAGLLPTLALAAGLEQSIVESELAPIMPGDGSRLLGPRPGSSGSLSWAGTIWNGAPCAFSAGGQGDLKSPGYVAFKRSTSLLAGIFLGVVVSNYSGMRLMGYLNQTLPGFLDQVPDLWDIVITGLMIGAGTKPTHDILGIITQLKNLIGSTALKQKEQAGAALAESILKLRQADAPAASLPRGRAGRRSRAGGRRPGAGRPGAQQDVGRERGAGAASGISTATRTRCNDNLYSGS